MDYNKFVKVELIIGAIYESHNALDANNSYVQNAGSAYIFKKTNGSDDWVLAQKITSNNRNQSDAFGSSVAISGKYAIIGASLEDDDANEKNAIFNAGAAYIFRDDTPLPVTLTSFEVSKIENQSLLMWSTSNETNSDYFEIQKSRDGRSWLALNEHVPANGSSHYYSFVDFAPFHGENLYRLKIVDLDGTFAFSHIGNVTFDKHEEMLIYPNPVSDRLYLVPSIGVSEIESVQIFNNLGQMVMNFQRNFKDGLDLTKLEPGVFSVQIKRATELTVLKVIVAR